MNTVSFLYEDLPVTITDEDVRVYKGIDLEQELKGESSEKVTQFLDTVHQHVYDFLIFTTGNRNWKIKIIEKYREQVEKTLKMALLVQAVYLLKNGNIEIFNGVVKTNSGTIDIKENSQLNEKIIAPTIVNMLSSTKPNLLFAGR